MAKPYEEMSNAYASRGQNNTDANLALDALMLGGIEADEYALKSFVLVMAKNVSKAGNQYTDDEIERIEGIIKAYVDNSIKTQDFSNYATKADLDAAILDAIEQCNEYANTQITNIHIENYVTSEDLEKGIDDLQGQINELFQSVSNGKNVIASAITDMGINAEASESFYELANKILRIANIEPGGSVGIDTSDATATAEDIKLGKSAYISGGKVYGTHEETVNGTNTSDATATPGDIVLGQTAYANGQKLTGTLNVNKGVSDISDVVDLVYSEVTDKITLNKYASTTKAEHMCVACYNNVVKYIIHCYKTDGVNYVKVSERKSDGSIGNIKTWNATEFGIPADTDTVTYTIKAVEANNLSDSLPKIIFTYLRNEEGETGYGTYWAFACAIDTDTITVDDGTQVNTLVPYWLYADGTVQRRYWRKQLLELANYYGYSGLNKYSIEINPADPNTVCVTGGYVSVNGGSSYAFASVFVITFTNIIEDATNNIANTISVFSTTYRDYGVYNMDSGYQTRHSCTWGTNGRVLAVLFRRVLGIIVFDDVYNLIINQKITIGDHQFNEVCIFSEDCTKLLLFNPDEGGIEAKYINIDYTNGSLSIGDGPVYVDEYTSLGRYIAVSTYSSKFLILIHESGCVVYGIDWDSATLLHPIQVFNSTMINADLWKATMTEGQTGNNVLFAPVNGSVSYITNSGNLAEFQPVINYEEIIGIKYDGRVYYDMQKFKLTAKETDVVNGKTFIGKTGMILAGTLEVGDA